MTARQDAGWQRLPAAWGLWACGICACPIPKWVDDANHGHSSACIAVVSRRGGHAIDERISAAVRQHLQDMKAQLVQEVVQVLNLDSWTGGEGVGSFPS